MAESKTKPNDQSVSAFIQAQPAARRADYLTLVDLMRRVTGHEPKMWGDSIVGFGQLHYKYASGHEGDTCLTGFSPRKQALTIYLWYGFEDQKDLLSRLGKYKTGKACLYVNNLDGVDLAALEALVAQTMRRQ
jgi:hypothetical protein